MTDKRPALINQLEFRRILQTEFPDLQAKIDACDGLGHVEMAEFQRYMAAGAKNHDWSLVQRCLRLADRFFREGDSYLQNAVYVSFLENIDNGADWWPTMRKMMSPDLQRGHDEMEEHWKNIRAWQEAKSRH